MGTKGAGHRLLAVPAIALAAIVTAAAGRAQTLSDPVFVNGSDPDELFLGTATLPSYERETSVALVSSTSGAFVTRFAALVTADGDGGPGPARIEPLAADYQILFSATAPGAYRLTVNTSLQGDLNLVNDSPNGAAADIGPVAGLLTGGTLVSGGLGLPDIPAFSGFLGGSLPVGESNTATIFAVSNGVPVPHTLRFIWGLSAQTNITPGDEAAVRLGGTSDIPTETAGDYPGSPLRVQADDGHFVSVTIESLCGNGVIDTGPSYVEDCDAGPANGTPGSCCAANCTLKPDGASCDDGDACTVASTCQSGVCTSSGPALCGLCETCVPLGGCVVAPRPNCKEDTLPRRSTLVLKDKTPDTGDQVSFKWVKGQATDKVEFGSPTTSDDYALCLFGPANTLIFKSTAPADGVCGTRPCWRELGVSGFSYRDPLRTPEGADRIRLRAGLQGKARASFTGKGPNLPSFPLPLALPVRAQLQAENGKCWEATFSAAGASSNTAQYFKAKAD